MNARTALLRTTHHVGEHVVAIGCVSTGEFSCRAFVNHFGEDVHKWPALAYVALGAGLYLAGFLTGRLVLRWLRKRTGDAGVAEKSGETALAPEVENAAARPNPALAPNYALAAAIVLSTTIATGAAVLTAVLNRGR
jgi:hypothetical protein